MPEAKLYQSDPSSLDYTPAAATLAGEVIQTFLGSAAKVPTDVASGAKGSASTTGIETVAKTTGQYWIEGAPLWWDHSENKATCVPPLVAGDRDFYLGVAYADAAESATEGKVIFNAKPEYSIDMQRDGGDTAVVLTAGTPYLYSRGGSLEAGFSATAEAQKLDWLSKRSFALSANWVLEAVLEVVTNCDADVGDLTVGVASGTHASDFQSVAEFAAFHLDLGADLNLDAESDDGTTDVDPQDTTVDWAVGTPIHLVIDGRDPSSVKFYVNGARVLSGTTFTLAAATGPLKAIFHLEKSSNDSPGVVQLDMLRVRTMQTENAQG